jgi:hypothetical protein
MAARRGNSTKYSSSTDSELDKKWRRSVSRDRLNVAYDRGKATSFANESIKGKDVAAALAFLADMTGDEAFQTAALALRAYGLAEGGLKQKTLQMMRDTHGTAARFAMPEMHAWVREGKSVTDAAARTAVQLGIPGVSFDAVVEHLRKSYSGWLEVVEGNVPSPQFPSGDTGRKLRVRFTRPWLGADNQPVTELMGVRFGDDGFGLAPDNREWRRLIAGGHISHCGVIETVGENPETKNQDAR